MVEARFEGDALFYGTWQECYDYLSENFRKWPQEVRSFWRVNDVVKETDSIMFDALAEDAVALQMYVNL